LTFLNLPLTYIKCPAARVQGDSKRDFVPSSNANCTTNLVCNLARNPYQHQKQSVDDIPARKMMNSPILAVAIIPVNNGTALRRHHATFNLTLYRYCDANTVLRYKSNKIVNV
jgi:hypothetical protein